VITYLGSRLNSSSVFFVFIETTQIPKSGSIKKIACSKKIPFAVWRWQYISAALGTRYSKWDWNVMWLKKNKWSFSHSRKQGFYLYKPRLNWDLWYSHKVSCCASYPVHRKSISKKIYSIREIRSQTFNPNGWWMKRAFFKCRNNSWTAKANYFIKNQKCLAKYLS
jgi:hypothetical protein